MLFLVGSGDRDIGRPRTPIPLSGNNLVSSRTERIVGQSVSSVSIVVIRSRDSPAGPLVLPYRPVLDVVVAPVDCVDLIAATVAGNRSNLCALAAGVVRAVVLKNLTKH
jgi:hypothetical protein